uniref:Synaptojanin 2 binding protein n=1 Tax=Oryzias sinensis TaxID=183150 RepID=A0A8C7YWU5_9TELE
MVVFESLPYALYSALFVRSPFCSAVYNSKTQSPMCIERDAMNDSGIYVSKIKEDGAAALDGRLQEGDKILSINGTKLENMAHRQVVNIFRCAGNQVELHVLKRPKEDVSVFLTRKPAPAGWTPSALPVLGFLLALSVCAVLVVRRFRSSN